MSSFVTPLLALVAVVALIPLALWLLKRTPLGSGSAGTSMRAVSALPLGTHQRLVTVEVGTGGDRRWLVLGVTQASISTLWTMEPQADAPAEAHTPQVHFSQLLSRLMSRDGSWRGR